MFLSRISSLNLLSFNIQNFGVTKYSNQGVIDNLIDVSEDGDQASMASVIKIVFLCFAESYNTTLQIIEEYDLVLVMEYVDVGQTVLPGFFEQLNKLAT